MQFYVLRFLLGAAEAGFFPAILYYSSLWFPAQWRGRVISRFYVAQPVSFIVLGVVSGPILAFDGVLGLQGWQWLFLLEAGPAILIGIIIFKYLPDSPETVAWLAPEERRWLTSTLAADAAANTGTHHHSVLKAITDRRVLGFGIIWFLYVGPINAFFVSMPQIIASKTGLDMGSVGQLTTISGVIGVVMLLGLGWHSDRRRERFWHIIVPWIIVAAAFAVLAFGASPTLAIIAVLLIAAMNLPSHPIFYANFTEALQERHRAVGIAAVNTFGQFSSFLCTSALGIVRDAAGGYETGLAAIAVCIATSVVVLIGVQRQSARAAV